MKRWYVAQVFSGFEEQVKADIVRRVTQEGLQEQVAQVLIPSAKLKQFFSSVEEDQQLFPGYVLVEADLTDQAKKLILATPRLMRFLGGNKEPMPISQAEIDRIVKRVKGEVVVAPREVEFVVGKEVEIADGPFAGFVGIVEAVDVQNETLKVVVSIFGRMTPVELSFNQVK